ncbi:WD40 repeat protein [Pontibacter aydingkolensis]|uniref:WD40 repeat domain-containing protein n=1 Tax=Pontibacter aydingkolensis TaxID=1911536 RepID=A0ABS7CNV7_9BACT|nr:WD40 repeat domain-containing protein [Pontibacter aydingkolensis]MBW7465527.1 WD40 repeat domain-containing protein [Pontibacter aydingkolensis]
MASKIQVQKVATLTGHRDCVYTLERSSDENVFFSGAGDGMVVAWDLNEPENGELIAKVTSSVYALRYVPDRNLLLIGQNQEGVQVIDLANKQILKSVPLPKVAIFDIIHTSEKVYVAMGNGAICVLNSHTFELETIIRKSDQSARCLAYNKFSNELAVGYSDNVVRIFDATSMAVKYELKSHTNSVFTVAYTPDGKLLLTGGRDAHLRVWEIENQYKERGYLIAHMYTINHITFSPDGRHFATCSMDKSIKVWDAETFKLLKVIDKVRNASHGTSVNKLFWSAHKNQLVSCSDDRTISVWDINLGSSYEDYTIRDQAKNV